MSVYNSEHNSPINYDHDDDIHDSVTRISKLDISDPLHLHHNDTTALTVVLIKLKGTENYQVWSCAMLLALEGKNKIGFIDGSCKRSNTNKVLGKQWDRVNAIVLGWILNSISKELFLGKKISKRAKHVWEELKETCDKVDRSIMFGLHNQINTLKQNDSSIADYYHKLNALWKQYDAMIELPKCVCNASEGFKKHNQLLKLMQFLMGLDDSYMQIRNSILSRETLPDVRSAYVTISSEESHRVAVGSIAGSSQRNQASAFVSNAKWGSGLVCENYGFNGLTIDRCFKIIGYHAYFRTKKTGQNFKKQSVSNNNSVRKSLSFGFSDEQMATLLSLIKDNKIGKNVQANMAGVNQHMTYTAKGLDNVVDISHLKIKVGHPNGTEAFISKIGNLKLSNGLTLYDVMVIPEYCVTLFSVHKMAKENKIFVVFDESKCYFVNQDLNLKNVLGTGDQCEGLYYYNEQGTRVNKSNLSFQCLLSQYDWHCRLGHPAEPVMNVLKKSLSFDKSNKDLCCEVCQRAKQTREPFPLSDHVSSSLGELVHLDLWGPYRVTSSERFKYFLTVVDDYTRAIWVYLIKSKDEISHFITVFYNLIENQFNKKIKVFRSDNETEFVNQYVNKFCADKDVNHINFFDLEYPEIPNDDERVYPNLNCDNNKSQSASSSSFESGGIFVTTDFPINSGNDADSSDNNFATQNEEVTTLEENVFSEGNMDQNPNTVKYGIEKYVRFKVRLVAQGFGQKEGIDYEKTFSPVVKMLDVNNAFLYGDLDEFVYMRPPEGYFPSGNKTNKGVFLALLVYVDYIIITGNNVAEIKKFKGFLKSKFMIKDLGKLKYFLGIEVVDIEKGICLNQRKYVLDLLSEYGMLACKPVSTPFIV
ncbi:ribonuclease H-like domain-containing protein [Tanacetum coccineum]